MKTKQFADTEYLSQHYLKDSKVLDDIVAFSDIEPDDIVLEVGPGPGVLTKRLVDISRKVIAVELDEKFRPQLKELYADNLEVIYANILNMKIPRIDRIVSNLPFNITEPFISNIINMNFKSATLLVGKNYGIQAVKDHPDSRLGCLTQVYFEVEYLRDVLKSAFFPEPSTDCSLLQLYPIKKKKLDNSFRKYILRCLWDQKKRPLEDALKSAISQYAISRGSYDIQTNLFIDQLKRHYDYPQGLRVDRMPSHVFYELYSALSKLKLKKIFGGHKPRKGSKNWKIEYGKYLK